MFSLRILALVVAAVIGFSATYKVSETLRLDARNNWKIEADKVAQSLSGTLLNWIEESYAPISGMTALFENSTNVTEIEFLNAYDGLEARATAFFIEAAAVYHFDGERGSEVWRLQYSTDPEGLLSKSKPLSDQPQILNSIKVANARFGEMILGQPFRLKSSNEVLSPITLGTSKAGKKIVILGLVNYDSLINGLFTLHVPKGLTLSLKGKYPNIKGQNSNQPVFGKAIENPIHKVTTRTVSGGAELAITWYVDEKFSDGPEKELADFSLVAGITGVVLIVLFFGFLLQRNRLISMRVQEATGELAASISSLEENARAREEVEKKLIKREAQLSETLNNMSEGILVIGKDNLIELYNSKVKTLLELPENYMRIGLPIYDLILFQAKRGDYGPGDPKTIARDRMLNGKEYFTEESLSGQVLEFTRKFVADGVVVTFKDITQRHRSGLELDQKIQELESFNSVAVGRELRMIELKREINELLGDKEEAAKYEIVD